jgi:hypothetical protein
MQYVMLAQLDKNWNLKGNSNCERSGGSAHSRGRCFWNKHLAVLETLHETVNAAEVQVATWEHRVVTPEEPGYKRRKGRSVESSPSQPNALG